MIPNKNAHVYVTALTHPGMTGKQNEDRYAVSSYRVSETDSTPALFAIVSDGIGGHRAGEIAAETAVDHISQVIAESDASQPLEVLERAIHEANQLIYQLAQSDLSMQGMGATVACSWIIGDRLYTTTVGDSRIYLVRNRRISQLNIDHTWVQEAIDRGILTRDQARSHPNVHVIRRYLGGESHPEVDRRLRLKEGESSTQSLSNQGVKLLPGDDLLLCSDGLTDRVEDEEIRDILLNNSLKAAAKKLVDLACERGGPDNITVILVSVPDGRKERGKLLDRERVLWLSCLSSGIVGILLALGAVGWLGWKLIQPPGVETPQATAIEPPPALIFTPASGLTPTVLPTLTLPPREAPGPTYTPWPTNQP